LHHEICHGLREIFCLVHISAPYATERQTPRAYRSFVTTICMPDHTRDKDRLTALDGPRPDLTSQRNLLARPLRLSSHRGLEHGTNDSNCAFSRKGFRERGFNPTHFAWVTRGWMRNQFWIGQHAPGGRGSRKSCRESRLEWPIACRGCVGRHCNTVVLRIPRQLPNSVELLGPGLLFITNLPAGVAVAAPFHFDTSAIGRISREEGARQPRSRGINGG
jgi:hypothetical protein